MPWDGVEKGETGTEKQRSSRDLILIYSYLSIYLSIYLISNLISKYIKGEWHRITKILRNRSCKRPLSLYMSRVSGVCRKQQKQTPHGEHMLIVSPPQHILLVFPAPIIPSNHSISLFCTIFSLSTYLYTCVRASVSGYFAFLNNFKLILHHFFIFSVQLNLCEAFFFFFNSRDLCATSSLSTKVHRQRQATLRCNYIQWDLTNVKIDEICIAAGNRECVGQGEGVWTLGFRVHGGCTRLVLCEAFCKCIFCFSDNFQLILHHFFFSVQLY